MIAGEIFSSGSWLTEHEIGADLGRCGRNVRVSPLARIVGNPKNLVLRDRVRIDDFVQIVVGDDHLVELGDDVHVGNHASLHGQAGLLIEAGAQLSAGVRIFTVSDAYAAPPGTKMAAAVTIGRRCILGANSVILPGGSMGEGATLGALSIVLAGEELEPWRLYAGIPPTEIAERRRE